MMEPIAVIGISFKLPQGTVDDESFWQMLEGRQNMMTEWPPERCNIEMFEESAGRPRMVKQS
jgi:acyl transferase domain-containing protein